MINLSITEDMCKVLYMHLQYASCFWRLLMLCVSVLKTFVGSTSVDSGVLDMG